MHITYILWIDNIVKFLFSIVVFFILIVPKFKSNLMKRTLFIIDTIFSLYYLIIALLIGNSFIINNDKVYLDFQIILTM